jgi:ribosomal protein S18 acetylase RimI-like enzyme
MRFELTDALIDDILFSMEDQEGEFLVDTREGMVAGGVDFDFDEEANPDDEGPEREERFIPLPSWDSSDGYRLMERFAAGFRNPLIRAELTGALNQGKGVFRAFKDALGRYPEAEKRWFMYKEREMKREILRWYNGLREEWGLERIGGEPEETGDLLLEDFRFRDAAGGDEGPAAELHRVCRGDCGAGAGPEGGAWVFPGDLALAAETGGGEFAGYVSAALRGGALYVAALEVRPEYRGLGIGEALLSRLMEEASRRGFAGITMDLPAAVEGFSRVLLRESFRPCLTRYHVKLGENTENPQRPEKPKNTLGQR